MKVKVADINSQEVIQGQDKINSSLWKMDSEEIKFLDSIFLSCNFKSARAHIVVSGKAYLKQDIRCSRCLQRVEKDKVVDLFLSYDKNSLGKFLEIDKDVREEILLQWPMKPLCNPNCKGLCPDCGINLNFEECKCDSQKKRSNINGSSKA